jgi:hypothetical protein
MNDPITDITLSPYVVHLYNSQLDNMIIYLTGAYDQTASALIDTVKAEKKILLLYLNSMMTEIKKRNGYSEYMRCVIMQNNMC